MLCKQSYPMRVTVPSESGGITITQFKKSKRSNRNSFPFLENNPPIPFSPSHKNNSWDDGRYQELLMQVNDIVFRMNIEGFLTEVSPSVTQILGYTPEEVIGKEISRFVQLESLKIIKDEVIRKIQNPDAVSRYEIPIISKKRQEIICEINSRLIKKPGKPLEIFGIIRDTTERKKMEDAIRTSEKKYREIFENSVEGLFRSSTAGQILDVNNAFATVFGYSSPEELILQIHHIGQLYADPQERKTILSMLEKFGVIKDYLVKGLHKSGARRWVRLNARLITGDDGEIIEGSVMDVTEEELLKKKFNENERVYRLLADNISDVIWTADMNMNLTFMSPSIKNLLGYSVDEAMHQPIHEVYIPESLNILLKARQQGIILLENGEPDSDIPHYLELGMYHCDGHIIWTETVISLIFSPENIPIGVVGSIRNINARKKIERAHQVSQSRLKEAQKIARVGDFELDLQTGMMVCSEEVFRIFGISQSSSQTRFDTFLAFFHPSDIDLVKNDFQEAIDNHIFGEFVHRIVLKDGAITHVHLRIRVMVNATGNAEKIIGTIQDITERMRLEEEREKLMKQIQRNIAELSILNDGIRNPLSIIEATLEVNPERPHEEIHRQIDRIDAMITQLDKRWAESEKIFSYLNKHYGIHY